MKTTIMHYVETLSFTGWAELSQEISTWSSFDRHLLTQQIDANLTSENVDKQLQFTQREGCHFMSYWTKNVKLIEIRILNQVTLPKYGRNEPKKVLSRVYNTHFCHLCGILKLHWPKNWNLSARFRDIYDLSLLHNQLQLCISEAISS